jgi:hypothetical protein
MVLNATRRDRKLTKESPGHCEPVTLVTPPDVENPHVRDTTAKLEDVIIAPRANLSKIPRVGRPPHRTRGTSLLSKAMTTEEN